jgi:hypothetical protein
VLEAARWSLSRGPAGLGEAERLLVAWARVQPDPSPDVRATLVLVLARAGRVDEARGTALSGATLAPSFYRDPDPHPVPDWMEAEREAARGTALLLRGDAAGALVLLERAAGRVPAPWRDFMAAQVATARRALPRVAPPPGGRVLQ